ncbi:MAG: DUF1801 domain-containing protein [Phycisphaerales bacterium]|jgi:hypothetical protein
MQSKAATVEQYLAELPADRRAAISAVRDVVRRNLDKQCAEGMGYGMIGWSVPHSVYPNGYHCDPRQPLPVAGLASQKNHMSLYLMSIYCGCEGGGETEHARWFREAWARTGKKLDMGKACIRFKKLEDLPLEVIGEAIRRVSAKKYIEQYEKALAMIGSIPRKRKPASEGAAKRTKATGKTNAAKARTSKIGAPKAGAESRASSPGARKKAARR